MKKAKTAKAWTVPEMKAAAMEHAKRTMSAVSFGLDSLSDAEHDAALAIIAQQLVTAWGAGFLTAKPNGL